MRDFYKTIEIWERELKPPPMEWYDASKHHLDGIWTKPAFRPWPVPNFRSTDPVTSAIAGQEIIKKGIAAEQQAICLACIKNTPGLTSAEIADRTGLERHQPARRLSELRRMNEIYSGDKRICSINGTFCLTWWPVGVKDYVKLEHLAIKKLIKKRSIL